MPYPNDTHPEFSFATAYEHDSDSPYDYIGNLDTAKTMANDGYRVVIHEGDGNRTKEELQKAIDDELARAVDCFGEDHRK
ncbi:hypothetical protein MUG78_17930 [Gordonia alkaliphila]|uniref:hypothetical protein n=1 Tax=Gordonia alkaliphila TaxID=1053547 RepID=UPI001FF2ABF0|nr:hypothetical protein [Gordonia alkaliphila]MCK0441282.1 hypothetical protein [Gordonia alkaliphila]